MAVNKRRYTYTNGSVAVNSLAVVASIEGLPVSTNIASGVKPLGIRLKLDITESDSGSSKSFSGELLLTIAYYYDDVGDVLLFDILPEGVTALEYPIVTTPDKEKWFHLIFPDLADWYNYIKVVISATSDGTTASFFIEVNTPNVRTSVLAETFTWQLI